MVNTDFDKALKGCLRVEESFCQLEYIKEVPSKVSDWSVYYFVISNKLISLNEMKVFLKLNRFYSFLFFVTYQEGKFILKVHAFNKQAQIFIREWKKRV